MKKQAPSDYNARKPHGSKHTLNACARIQKLLAKLANDTSEQIAFFEEQIKALMTENANLRAKLKMPKRKEPPVQPESPFTFPELSDSPVDILKRRIEEILPRPEDLDSKMQGARTRVLGLFRDRGWESIGDFLRKNKNAHGPDWEEMLEVRNLSYLSVSFLAAVLNHFSVDRKNLPAEVAVPTKK